MLIQFASKPDHSFANVPHPAHFANVPGSADTVCPRPPLTPTFDRLTLKLVYESHPKWRTFQVPSKFGHARPLGSRIIRYVRDRQRDRQTDGRTKATLPHGRGHNNERTNKRTRWEHYVAAYQGRVQQQTGRIVRTTGTTSVRQISCWTTFILINVKNCSLYTS